MFYAKYKTRNSQSICGNGRDIFDNIKGGFSNHIGMTDTTSGSVSFLGVEDCWGGGNEWIEGIHYTSSDHRISIYDKGDFSGSPYDMIDIPTKRQAYLNESKWLKYIKHGDYMDILHGDDYEIDGDGNHYYCDKYSYRDKYYDMDASRSGPNGSSEYGISYLRFNSDSSYDTSVTRLAFDGGINIIKSSSEYKKNFIDFNFSWTLDQSKSNPKQMITVSGNPDNLLNKFRRCLCKKVSDNNVKICYLDNSNSNYYHDGTFAELDGTEGDVMVYFPEFWYKTSMSGNSYTMNISSKPISGYTYINESLVGAYEGFISNSKLYSRSYVDSSRDTINNFSNYSRNRGKGYHIIDYQQHCILAWMFYAKYKTTNSRIICGSGHNNSENTVSGDTNLIGNFDTNIQNSLTGGFDFINFLGIEACWGYKSEIIEGIHFQSSEDKINVYDKGYFYGLQFSSISSPTKRQFNALKSESSDYIRNMYLGSYMDMIPSAGGSSNSTYFCDFTYYSNKINDNAIFLRSGSADIGGISCLVINDITDKHGSRLAFDGNITVVDDVATFKALPVL